MESINLFESILNEKALDNIPIFLIFNKIDLFEEKMRTGDLSLLFDDYDELPSSSSFLLSKRINSASNSVKVPKSEFSHAIDFIRNKFLENKKRDNVNVLYTVAIDIEKVKSTMNELLQILQTTASDSQQNTKQNKRRSKSKK